MTKKATVKKKSKISKLRTKVTKRKTALRAKAAKPVAKAKVKRHHKKSASAKAKSLVSRYLKPLRKARVPWISGFFGMAFLAVLGIVKMTSNVEVTAPPAIHPDISYAPPAERAQPAEAPRAPAEAAPAAVVAQSASKSASTTSTSSGLTKYFSANAVLPVGERVARWSDYLLNSPNLGEYASSLGDAPKNNDSAPFLNAKYDCTTFVETVAALARSKTANDFYGNLIAIRYKDGNPTYLSRNHFPEADWIPNNEKAGILKDVTEEVASKSGVDSKTASKEIHRAEWLAEQVKKQKVSRSIASAADSSWSGNAQAKVAYIPIEDVSKIYGSIPNGAVINFVRSDDPHHDVLVTHQGFVVKVGNEAYLRHVSVGGNIRTVLLKDYISKPTNRGTNDWPVIGINLNQLADSQ